MHRLLLHVQQQLMLCIATRCPSEGAVVENKLLSCLLGPFEEQKYKVGWSKAAQPFAGRKLSSQGLFGVSRLLSCLALTPLESLCFRTSIMSAGPFVRCESKIDASLSPGYRLSR